MCCQDCEKMKKTYHTNRRGGFFWGMLLVFVGLNLDLHAQVAVSNTNNPSSLAQKLSGPGVTVSNATILCENQQSGIFVAATPIFGLDSGIVLTTGRAGTLLPFYGVNGSEFNLANFNHGNGGDPDLTSLAGTTTHDRCILEFDFKANGDTVYFQYLFGSEEYPAYNCANYNDVFGFFISGPGYSTPLNLALIPNTNIPVSINSINNGVISAGGNISNCTSMGAGSPFTSMYNSNVGGTNLTYSGFTDLLTSKASITPCSTYHLKLAIADGFDNIIDSGVFLKAGSLTSNTFEIEVAADSVLNNQPYVHEGCDSAVIRIKRKFAQTSSFYPDTVNLIVSGTAISGIDYPAIATSFAFTANPNDTVRTVYIEAFNDLINEGTETIKLSIFDNCSTPSDSISFLVMDPPKINLVSNDTSICLGKSVVANLVSDPGFQFSWSPSNGVSNVTAMNPTLTPTGTTTYVVTATYGNCFPVKDSFKITTLPLPIQNISVTNPLCAGQTNGSLQVTSSSTPNPLSFMLNPGNIGASGSPAFFGGLGVGTYTVTVTNGNGCSKTNTATLNMPATMSWSSTTATTIPCNSGNIGQIVAVAAGGTGTKTYTLTPGAVSNNTGNFTNLAAGTYTVQVADANNCSVSTAITVNQSQGLSWVSVTSTPVFCYGFTDGTITLQATGTSSNISYALQPGGVTNTTGVFTNLGTNTYTITASDPNGCYLTTLVNVTSPPGGIVIDSVSTTNLNCANQPIGTISISASGGTAPLSYTRQPGNSTNTTGNFTGLTFGTYTLTVTDANGCSLSTTAVITSPPAITYTVTVTPPTCVPGNNGIVTITAIGGVTPYTYSLNGQPYQSSNTYTTVTYGAQTVYIKDANGCVKSYNINPPNPSPITLTNTTVQLTCTDTMTDIVVTANNGVPPYQYTLLPPNLTNNTGVFYNFGQGSYTVNVVDATGCSKSMVISLVPPQLTWQQFIVSNIPCTGIGTGSLASAIQGGTSPITYNLQPSNTTNSSGTFANLAVNQYTVLATDATGCTAQSVFNIIVSPPFSFPPPTVNQVKCWGAASGQIQVIPSGGVNPFSYTLQPNGATSTNGVFNNVSAGTYTIQASDASGCSNSITAVVTQNPLITYTITPVPPNCSPGGNGTITINASGGNGAYSYKLNSGTFQTSNVFTGLVNGIYTITIKDGVNCTKSTTVNLPNPSNPVISSLSPGLIVCHGGTTSLTTSVTGAVNPITYSANPGGLSNNTGIFSGLQANTYTVSISDANNCTATSSITINQSPAMGWASVQVNPVVCNGAGNGSITVASSGGNPPYSYTRQPGNITNSSGTFSGLSNITYTITSTDANGCTKTTAVTVTQPNFLSWTNLNQTNIVCHGQSTGAIDKTLNGGTGSFTYTLNPGNLSNTTGSFSGLAAGVYTMTGTDANGCTAATTFTLSQPPLLQINSVSNTIPSCVPGNDGSINVVVGGGTPAYAYSLNGGANQISSTFNNIGVSVYTVQVTDFNGCTASSIVNVINPGVPSFNSFTVQHLSCYNIPTGVISSTAIGGTGTLTYSIQPLGFSNTTGQFSSLASNNYVVSVTDANGCTATSNVVMTQPPQLLWDSVDNRDVSCYNGSNGLVTSSASGGTGTLSYYLAPVGIQNFSGAFFGLGTGNYTLTVTDSNGCTIQSAFAINQFPQILWNPPVVQAVSCTGGSNGGFSITASGGAGSFTYDLLPNGPVGTNGSFSGLTAGTYTVLATDANNCTVQTTVTIPQPSTLNVTTPTLTPATCIPGCDGTSTSVGSGGVLPYQFALNGGAYQNANSFASLCSGTYTVQIKDANSCTATSSFVISTANGPNSIVVNTTPTSCYGATNGSLTVSITGGNGAVNYLIQPGNQSNTTGNFNGLTAGNYTLTATDASGCTISSISPITQPAAVNINFSLIEPVTCFNGSDGAVHVSGSGGSGSFTYQLSPLGTSNTNGNFNALIAGTFTIQVSDANSCTSSATVIIQQPADISLQVSSVVPVSCFGTNTGSIQFSATGGNGVYTYSIANPLQSNTNGTFNNLLASTYTLLATDTAGCIGDSILIISQPAVLQISSLSSTIPSCVPGNDATITATVNGGTPGYQYALNNGAPQSSGVFNSIGVGTYTLTVTDSKSCTATSVINVVSPNAPQILSVVKTQASCQPGCDASLTISASGGTSPLQYTVGSGYQSGNQFNNLCASTYTVQVKDAVGCTYSSLVSITTVNGPILQSSNVTQIPCFGLANGSVGLNVTGGTQPITYTLMPGSQVSTSPLFTALAPGTYTVTGSDLNGCSLSTTLTISQPPALQFSNLNSTPALCQGVSNGTIVFSMSGGTGSLSYTITPSGVYSGSSSFTGLAGNLTYTIQVTDANGCTKTATQFVAEPPSLQIDSFATTQVTCNGANNGSIFMQAIGGNGSITYSLNPGNQNNSTGLFTNLPGNTFTVTATDLNGCAIQTVTSIQNPSSLLIANASATDITCFGMNNGSISLLAGGGMGMISYLLLPGNVSSPIGQFTNLGPGTYDALATDANGCADTVQLIVNEPGLVHFTNVQANGVLCSGQNNGALIVTASGGVGTIQYTVQPGNQSNTSGVFNNLGGNQLYTVTAQDQNGCTEDTTVFVVLPSALTIDSVTHTDVDCHSAQNGSITMYANGGTGAITFNLLPGGITNQTGGFQNLAGNTYTIVATDINGCSLSSSVSVYEPPALQFVSALSTNIICFGQQNGTITVQGTGGTPGLNYLLSPGNSSNTIGSFSSLQQNTYTVTLSDANACSITTSLVVVEPPLVKFDSVTVQHVKCFGQSNAMIHAFASGGVGTLTYTITPSPSVNTTGIFNGLSTGSYTISVADTKSCSASTIVNIFQPQPLVENLVSSSNVTCYGGNDGSIIVQATGGTLPYVFTQLPNGISSSTGSYLSVSAGVYTMLVTDAKGCQDSIQNIGITQPPPIVFTTVTHEDITCYYDTTGSISAVATGGTGAIVFTLNPQVGVQSSWGQFENLKGGIYTLTATDASGCTATSIVIIKQNLEIVASEVNLSQPICHGDANGWISMNAVGGVSPLTYSMNGGPFINPGLWQNLVAGTYNFTIMDALGCVKDTTMVLTEPDIVHATVDIGDVKCPGQEDGTLRIFATGGRGDFTYYVKPGLNINKHGFFQNLGVGQYTITVKDSSNCVFDTTVVLKESADAMDLKFEKKNLGCFGFGTEGWAQALVTGGTPPYSYAWQTNPIQTTDRIDGLRYGYYSIVVTDASGCELNDKIYIEPGPCCEEIFLPNAFSPNGDGKNDEWRVVTAIGLDLQQLVIYDRWGNKVWETTDIANGWDGNFRGKKMDTETYFYLLRYKCLHDGKNYTLKGDLILLR